MRPKKVLPWLTGTVIAATLATNIAAAGRMNCTYRLHDDDNKYSHVTNWEEHEHRWLFIRYRTYHVVYASHYHGNEPGCGDVFGGSHSKHFTAWEWDPELLER